MLSAHHAITDAQITRDLVVIDLIYEPGAHGVQLAFPIDGGCVDGLAYVSRFSPAQRCLALWSGAESAITWFTTVAFWAHPELDTTLHAMGIRLLD